MKKDLQIHDFNIKNVYIDKLDDIANERQSWLKDNNTEM